MIHTKNVVKLYYRRNRSQDKAKLPHKKLIMDVSTRWNSTLNMLSRYLELSSTVVTVLTSLKVTNEIQHKKCELLLIIIKI